MQSELIWTQCDEVTLKPGLGDTIRSDIGFKDNYHRSEILFHERYRRQIFFFRKNTEIFLFILFIVLSNYFLLMYH